MNFEAFDIDMASVLNQNAKSARTGNYVPEEAFPDYSDKELEKFIADKSTKDGDKND